MNNPANPIDIARDARVVAVRALAEDGPADVTSEIAGAAGIDAVAVLEYRSGGVLAGLRYAAALAQECGGFALRWAAAEGEPVQAGLGIAELRGDLAAILRAERSMLNILQRACGIASLTRQYVVALADTTCRLLHTRKTTPGLRGLEVSAVLAGGGGVHRVDLATQVLLKDNHWHALRSRGLSLREVCDAARSRGVCDIYIEVETETEVRQACRAGATRLLVDNRTPAEFHALADLARGLAPGIEIEASGGITLENARDYALAGADFVSVGALTHSAPAADLAIEVVETHI